MKTPTESSSPFHPNRAMSHLPHIEAAASVCSTQQKWCKDKAGRRCSDGQGVQSPHLLKVPSKTDNMAQGTAIKEAVSPELVVLTLKTVAEKQPET